jgi:hypothetical protein
LAYIYSLSLRYTLVKTLLYKNEDLSTPQEPFNEQMQAHNKRKTNHE